MKSIKNTKILVVGDIMLDKYIIGKVDRISPEAPVPVVNVVDEYYTLGGCGNVVRNLAEVGAKVSCFAATGNDKEGSIIFDELNKLKVSCFLIESMKQTTVKERVIESETKSQMIRIDRENIEDIESRNSFSRILVRNYDIIIVSDYAKGMITENLMKQLKETNMKIVVDPKPSNSYLYNDIFAITPNRKEWELISQHNPEVIKTINYLLITKGSKGMDLIENVDKRRKWKIQGSEVPVYNLSGAGDVVIAIMSLCISMGYDILTSCKIANDCASYSVTQPATSVVPKNIFMNILANYN